MSNTPLEKPTNVTLTDGYGLLAGESLDEMWSAEINTVRPHWQPLMSSLDRLGQKDLSRNALEAERLLRENGVTYNVHSDLDAPSKTWELDPVPLPIEQKDWDELEACLGQRATIFNLLLQDLYGERRLIKEGIVPPELIFSNPSFLRPCDQMPIESNSLLFFASDVSRGPDGQMWVTADRIQAPSGAGHALENRIVMTRLFPDTFREIQVHRLSLFFRTVRESLAKLKPNREDPRIVVLTAGPSSETYFEHAYLASYLGYPLVQGNDLTVKDGKVWLKSIEGLKRVDIILRRLNDELCDPLELAGNSKFGVPGLLQAVREKNVVIANPLGAGVLESPGLLPFLPAISEFFLKEHLKIPSVATWWCGHKNECSYVLDNLDKLIIKSVHNKNTSVFCGDLSQEKISELRNRIKKTPYLYVAQQPLSFSTVPTFIDNKLQPMHCTTRSFLVATDDGYMAMPGGLTRVTNDANHLQTANKQGGISKDTWILTSATDKQLQVEPQVIRTRRFEEQESILPSRAAESLFWVGRYIERTESSARLLRTVIEDLALVDNHGDESNRACLQILLQGLTTMTGTTPGFTDETDTDILNRPYMELKSLIVDAKRTGTIAQVLRQFVRAAFGVRDLWSSDTWRTIDDIDEELKKLHMSPINLHTLRNRLDDLISYMMAFIGLTSESMVYDNGRHLLDIGRRIERALMQISLLRYCLEEVRSGAIEHLLMEALLSTQESLITHRRRFREYQRIETVITLLLLDVSNPRSLAYQVSRINQFVNHLPNGNKPQHLSGEQRICLAATTRIRLATADSLIQVKEDKRFALKEFLDEIEKHLLALSSELHHTYFSHTESAQQLTKMQSEIEP